jgi:hypothetical protein
MPPLVALVAAVALLAGEEPAASVGMPVWIRDLVLPGTELEVAPVSLETPVIVRIADVRPHGTAFRYDLVVYGLEVGTFDLRERLVRKDGTKAEGLPELPLVIGSVLPPGRVLPSRPERGELPALGGYRALLWAGGAAWLAGLWAILRWRRAPAAGAAGAARPPLTAADRLAPLVEKAMAGELSQAERAQLELTLIAFWRTRLDLHGASTASAIATLRAHERAGPLLQRLEDWLHRPGPTRTTGTTGTTGATGTAGTAGPNGAGPAGEVDIAALLAPYREPAAAARAETRAETGA